MPIAQSLNIFQSSLGQCDSLIATAHRADQNGAFLFPQRDREQISVAAFLNMFIAWEEFLEAAIGDFMMGESTVQGSQPVKYVSPPSRDHSTQMTIHINRFFDFANHDNIRKIARLFFQNGYPFDAPISSITADLADLKTIRNACAHFSSTTKLPLESLATRIFGQPQPGISVYNLLMADDPRASGSVTVYAAYRDKLLAAASLTAHG